MAVTGDDVRKVAALSRLHLGDEELAGLTADVDRILAYVEQLRAVDTDGVAPLAHVTGLEGVTRDDGAGPMLSVAAVLANAPQASDAAFLVPRAVER